MSERTYCIVCDLPCAASEPTCGEECRSLLEAATEAPADDPPDAWFEAWEDYIEEYEDG